MPPHQRQQEDLAQDAVADDAEADKDESGGYGDRAVLENQQVKTPKDVDGAHDDDQPRPEAAIRFGVGILDLAHDAGDEATRLAQTSPMPAKTCPATTFGVSSDLTISIPQTMPIRAR